MEIRPVQSDEHERLGALTVDAYTRLDGHVPEPDYEAQLADIAGRSRTAGATVLVAVEDGHVLGGVTFVDGPDSPLAEFTHPDGAGIRMLAVEPGAQGRGVGTALTCACLDRARALGRHQVLLHSTPWMTTAHRIYERLGFRRDPSLDWTPVPGIDLLGFRLDL
jgi:GNAT superfamily N-acetyltransferase